MPVVVSSSLSCCARTQVRQPSVNRLSAPCLVVSVTSRRRTLFPLVLSLVSLFVVDADVSDFSLFVFVRTHEDVSLAVVWTLVAPLLPCVLWHEGDRHTLSVSCVSSLSMVRLFSVCVCRSMRAITVIVTYCSFWRSLRHLCLLVLCVSMGAIAVVVSIRLFVPPHVPSPCLVLHCPAFVRCLKSHCSSRHLASRRFIAFSRIVVAFTFLFRLTRQLRCCSLFSPVSR